MDPYSRKNGYPHRGSVGNSGQQYEQSPAFGNQYGPQYAQQQAQQYAKGPPNTKYNNNTRKHAYSVDHSAQNNPNQYVRNNRDTKYNYNHNQYISQQQYQQQQYQLQQQQLAQQQLQQQYMQQQQQQQQQQQNHNNHNNHNNNQRRRKQRKQNNPLDAPLPSDDPYYFPDTPNQQNQNMSKQRKQRRQPPQHQHNYDKPISPKQYQPKAQRQQNATQRNKRRGGGTRPKSPYANDEYNRSGNQNKQRRDSGDRRRTRRVKNREKNSVPNVSTQNQMTAPQKKMHHNSTPNANANYSARKERKRRKKPTNKDNGYLMSVENDPEYESTDSGIVYKNGTRSGSPGKQTRKARNGGLDRVHEERVEQARRGKKNKASRTKSPYDNSNNGNKGRRGSSQNPEKSQRDKKRRHTTQTDTYDRRRANNGKYPHSKSPNPRGGGRRGKKQTLKSKSPNPHRKSAGSVAQSSHAKLNKGKLAEKFVIREKLGRGNFSVVRRVIRKEDQKEFAAKIISTRTMSPQEIKDTHDEVDILAKVWFIFYDFYVL